MGTFHPNSPRSIIPKGPTVPGEGPLHGGRGARSIGLSALEDISIAWGEVGRPPPRVLI